MENNPQNQPQPPHRAPHVVPRIQDIRPANSKQINRALDAIAPPHIDQEAAATRALARDLEVQEHPTGQMRYGVPVSEWRIGNEPIHLGPAETGETRLKMEYANHLNLQAGAPELVPPTIDDIRFGTGRVGRTIVGKVIASKVIGMPVQPPQPTRSRRFLPRIEARHAAPRKELSWRRRAAAGMAAALALTSAIFFTGGGSHNEAVPKPQPTHSAPEYTAKPDTSTPALPAERAFQFSFEDGNNDYVYTTDEQGTVTQITGTLGEGENPWTLTEGAYKILIKDEATPGVTTQEIAESDPFMDSSKTQQQARKLQAGTQVVWRPTSRENQVFLKA